MVMHSPTKRQLAANNPLRNSLMGHSSRPISRSKVAKAAIIAGVVLVVAVVVMVPVMVTQVAVHRPRSSGQPLSVDYCEQLPDGPRQLCSNYHDSQGSAKFTAAADWRHASQASYECAGIEAECLNSDLASNTAGTSCQPLSEGSVCGEENQQRCETGFCGGAQAVSSSQAAAGAPPAAPTTTVPSGKPRDDGADDTIAAADIAKSRAPAMTAAPNATWPTAIAAVWPSKLGTKVPETFLATSHEWRRIKDYGGANTAAWAEIFGMLDSSPILRIGGASQDAMTEVPGEDVWGALRKLQQATNCRYIIGLPLWQKNAVDMSKQIMAAARKDLGDSLMGFELGNEPEFWPTGLGGYDTSGKWVAGFEAYAAYFHRVASALNPCSDGKPVLSGPGWGNVNTQDPSMFAKIVAQGKCYLWESNTHYYPYINNETVTAPELLSQWLQDFALDKFKAYVTISKRAGLDIRISETNSLYGGGRAGLSDTLAGTFWVLDALMAWAQTGARAFHLHWGRGVT